MFTRKLRKNKFVLTTITIILIVYCFLSIKNLLKINLAMTSDDHFNIITICSVLAGFLFSSLGIMISGLDNSKLKRLEIGGYLDKYFGAIYLALFINISTIIISYIIVLDILNKFKNILLHMERFLIFTGIILFIECFIFLIGIIKKIRSSIQTENN